MNETATPVANTGLKDPWGSFKNSSIPAPKITGHESKKEILAESLLAYPRKRAAIMVTPDREAPGISARLCAAPIMSASLKVKPSIAVFCAGLRSAR